MTVSTSRKKTHENRLCCTINRLRYRVSLNQATVLKRTYVHKTLQNFRENHFSLFEQSFGENEIRKEQWAKRMMGTGNEIKRRGYQALNGAILKESTVGLFPPGLFSVFLVNDGWNEKYSAEKETMEKIYGIFYMICHWFRPVVHKLLSVFMLLPS